MSGRITDVQWRQAVCTYAVLNPQNVRAIERCLKVRTEQLAQFLLREYGVVHRESLLHVATAEGLHDNLSGKITMVLDTHRHIASGQFDLLLQTIYSQTSDFSGFNPSEIIQSRLNMVRYLPMPHEQLIEVTARGKKPPISLEKQRAQAQRQNEMTERLYKVVDEDDQKENEEDSAELEEFVLSKAGLVTGSRFHVWYTLILEWQFYRPAIAQKAQQFLDRIQGAKMIGLEASVVLEVLPPDLPFRRYVACRSIFSTQRNLDVEFAEAYRENLYELFVENDQARREVVYLTSCVDFTDFVSVPNTTRAEDFLERMLIFCKLRRKVVTALSQEEQNLLFAWVSESLQPPQSLLEIDYKGVPVVDMIRVTHKLVAEAHVGPRDRWYCFASLCRLRNKMAFLQFLEAAAKEGLPVMRSGFLNLFFNARYDVEEMNQFDSNRYGVVLGNFMAVNGMLGHYHVPMATDRFWCDLCRCSASFEERIKPLTEYLHEDSEYSIEFYNFLTNYLYGRLEIEHFEALAALAQALGVEFRSVEMVEILSGVNNPVAFPISQERAAAAVETLSYLRDEYGLTLGEIGALFFELVNLEFKVIRQELQIVLMMEKFISVRLRRQDIYHWMLYHPKVLDAGRIVEKLFELRSQIQNLYLEEFALPTPLLTAFHETFSQLYLLEQEGAEFVRNVPTSFHNTLAVLGIQIVYSFLPTSIQLLSDFVSKTSMEDAPVVCGEEDRTQLHTQSLSLFCADTKAIWRGWEIPQDLEKYPVFTAHLVQMHNFETYTIRAPVEMAWSHFLEDAGLIGLLHEMCRYLGEENHEHGEPLAEGTELERHLHLFPHFAKVWDEFEPAQLEKNAVGEIFFRFVKALKLGFRKAIITTEPTPHELLSSEQAPCGHVYRVQNRYSLLPPNSPITPRDRVQFTVGDECNELAERWIKMIRGGEEVGDIVDFPKPQISKKIMMSFTPYPTELNEVILTIGDVSHKVRYVKLIAHERFREMLKWHILLLMDKVYRHAQ